MKRSAPSKGKLKVVNGTLTKETQEEWDRRIWGSLSAGQRDWFVSMAAQNELAIRAHVELVLAPLVELERAMSAGVLLPPSSSVMHAARAAIAKAGDAVRSAQSGGLVKA